LLERALRAKEDLKNEHGRVLGVGAPGHVMDGGYTLWTDSLRRALEKEGKEVLDEVGGAEINTGDGNGSAEDPADPDSDRSSATK
jgi:hypothetical protein